MKSIAREKQKKEEYELPTLFKSTDDATIIIAYRENETYFDGFVISSTNINNPIGHYSKFWDKKRFEIFNGEVVLSND